MHKVLFDYTYYQAGKYHGGGEYGDTIIRKVLTYEYGRGMFGIFFYANKRINKEIVQACKQNGWLIHPILDMREISSIVECFSYDTIYSALPYGNSWRDVHLDGNVHFIGTFHGTRRFDLMKFEETERMFWGNNRIEGGNQSHDYLYKCYSKRIEDTYEGFNEIFDRFSNITVVTVSQNSRATLLSFFPQLEEKQIKVLYSPPKKAFPPTGEEYLEELGVEKKNYALVISSNIWYKNALRVVLAYDKLFSAGYSFVPENYRLVVVGIDSSQTFSDRIENKDRFVFLDYLKPEKLERLYCDAHLFVFPSMNEGFGYPPLEAMKYGTMCACSVNTSIAEICGNMAILFNPLLIDEIFHKIMQSFFEEVRNRFLKRIEEDYSNLAKKQESDLDILVNLIVGE